MATISGANSASDIRISRRGCLRVGGLALGGLALPEILRAEAAAGARPTAKGVIMVVLPGGPSHLDMYDLKPDAPAEVRGEFRPIASRVPGIEICELLPQTGSDDGPAHADSVARRVPRRPQHTLVHDRLGVASAHGLLADRPGVSRRRLAVAGSDPLQAIRSAHARGVPPSVDLTPNDADARFILRTATGQPGYLGKAHAAFEVAAMEQGNLSLAGDRPESACRTDEPSWPASTSSGAGSIEHSARRDWMSFSGRLSIS